MTTITSPQNPKLQELRKLWRRRERERSQSFVAEGEDLIEAAALAGRKPLVGYRLAGSGIGGEGFIDVEPDALASACTLASGTRALAVYPQRYAQAPTGPLCLYLHGLSDPGNVGAVLRSAHAFGVSSVALGPNCADPHSPKAVRASMGAIFDVSMVRGEGVGEPPGIDLSRLPGRTVALATREGLPLHELDRDERPLTLLLGAEREGLPEQLLQACDLVAHIPIASESLNAAMAATVALYELTRDASSRVRA
ncbi:MAG TPA: RNA methyltransferase [Solirubrobacteraceae bacterium]|jgi:TrmH family RNA methyltransferase